MTRAAFLAKDDTSKPRANQSRLPFSDDFFDLPRRYVLRQWRPYMDTALSFQVDSVFQKPTEITTSLPTLQWRNLADLVLVEVFRSLDQTDRIRSASLVSRRFNRLVYARGIWTEVAVVDLTKDKLQCTRRFLKKVSPSLQALYIGKSRSSAPFRIIDVLPRKLHNVTFFEVHESIGSNENEVNGCLKYPHDFNFIDTCMPKLRCLVVDAALEIRNPHKENSWTLNLGLLGPEIFSDLRSFSLRMQRHVKVAGARTFLTFRPAIEQLQVYEFCSNWWSETQMFRSFEMSNLRGLSVCANVSETFGIVFSEPMTSLRCFQPAGLVFLDLARFVCDYDIIILRQLHSLEHLHIRGAWHWFRDLEYMALFSAPRTPSRFPSRLKYLRIEGDEETLLRLQVVRICKNCPLLRAVSLGGSDLRLDTVVAFNEFLRELEVVKIKYLSDLATFLERASNPDDLFPHLRFVCASEFRPPARLFPQRWAKSEKEISQSIFAKKPDLIVKVEGNYLSYKWNSCGEFELNDVAECNARISEALMDVEGVCCTRSTKYDCFSAADDEMEREEDIRREEDSTQTECTANQELDRCSLSDIRDDDRTQRESEDGR